MNTNKKIMIKSKSVILRYQSRICFQLLIINECINDVKIINCTEAWFIIAIGDLILQLAVMVNKRDLSCVNVSSRLANILLIIASYLCLHLRYIRDIGTRNSNWRHNNCFLKLININKFSENINFGNETAVYKTE